MDLATAVEGKADAGEIVKNPVPLVISPVTIGRNGELAAKVLAFCIVDQFFEGFFFKGGLAAAVKADGETVFTDFRSITADLVYCRASDFKGQSFYPVFTA
ncbi:MAG: hypothetical protein A4E66_01284 [Syntrophus sp. PtaB.Bin001]|nr:MAG: hypothetical protein A4E66_01284 [Syntrophus sp. PtaB.Bin001]